MICDKKEYGRKSSQNSNNPSDTFLEILRNMKKLDQEYRFLYRDLNLTIAEHEAGLFPFKWRSLVISCNQFSGYRVFIK
jgi:hypothetical protein